MTFSLVAVDAQRRQIGVVVESKFLAVGAIVPWAKAGVGAIATQSFADLTFGQRGIGLLENGLKPEEVIEELLRSDGARETRQVGVVAADGRAAAFTGGECIPFAGSMSGFGYSAQGNILKGPEVLNALVLTLEQSAAMPLADRLVDALTAAQAAGGDRRGQQSAALLVVSPNAGYGGNNDRMIDLRIDDHVRPVQELRRLLELHRTYFGKPQSDSIIAIDPNLRSELAEILRRAGHDPAVEGFHAALFQAIAWQNLEERWIDDQHIDRIALEYLRNEASLTSESATSPRYRDK